MKIYQGLFFETMISAIKENINLITTGWYGSSQASTGVEQEETGQPEVNDSLKYKEGSDKLSVISDKLEKTTGWYGSSQASTGVEQEETIQPEGNNSFKYKVYKCESLLHNFIYERGGKMESILSFAGEGRESNESIKVSKKSIKRGGENIMRIFLALGLIVLICGIASALQTTDLVILTVTPVFQVSVNISSTTNDFGEVAGAAGTVNLGSSRTICVGRIQNDGNVATYWDKWAQSTAADNGTGTWTLDTTNITPGLDHFRLLAVTTGTAVNPNFLGSGTNRTIAGNQSAEGKLMVKGGVGAKNNLVEGPLTSAVSPRHVAGEYRNLWVSIMMPSSISGATGAYSMTLSVMAKTTGP